MLYLAAGIDPELSTIFVQSHVSAHAELAWILNCVTPMGWLGRMHQYKEKSAKQRENVGVGLFDYPVLMAADILLYHANFVPVGEDQKQHIEITRDIAIRFNRLYGETFTVPEPMIREVGARIMGLDDPTKKMSKSEPGSYHALNLLDPPDVIRRKITRAVTDSSPAGVRFDPERPGIYNLLVIYELLSGLAPAEIEERYRGKGYAEFKRDLAEVVVESLRPLQGRYYALADDPAYIETVLRDGADRARAIAERTLAEVKRKVGVG